MSATDVRARANGETFVSATMCPRLPGALGLIKTLYDSRVRPYFVK